MHYHLRKCQFVYHLVFRLEKYKVHTVLELCAMNFSHSEHDTCRKTAPVTSVELGHQVENTQVILPATLAGVDSVCCHISAIVCEPVV